MQVKTRQRISERCFPPKLTRLHAQPRSEPSAAAVTKFLLSTLSDESNPITHSDSGENVSKSAQEDFWLILIPLPVYAFSTSSGHQVSEGQGNRRAYLEHRAKKISMQTAVEKGTAPEQPQVLINVKCYISGFLENTTDLEMKRIISSAGGRVLCVSFFFFFLETRFLI
jgi:hypothetical protein